MLASWLNPKDGEPENSYRSFYEDDIQPGISYWSWCPDTKENCQQNLSAGIYIGKTEEDERIFLGKAYGGLGGKHTKDFHEHVEGENEFILEPELTTHRISDVKVWNCKDKQVGMEWNLVEANCEDSNCKKKKLVHLGCGTDLYHRDFSRDNYSDNKLILKKDETITSVKIYVSGRGVRSRRVIGLEICADEQCIDTKMTVDQRVQWYQYDNYVHEIGSTDVVSTKGKIINFHGKMGHSIDGLGVYTAVE